jgi:hypothetical protein
MSVMINNVADAIVGAADADNGVFIQKALREPLARAAITSLREPSEGMVLAGAKKVRGGTAYDCAAATWRAMVDELLRD